MTKRQLVDGLVAWRQSRGGSISGINHRRLLQTRTHAELQKTYDQIMEMESWYIDGFTASKIVIGKLDPKDARSL